MKDMYILLINGRMLCKAGNVRMLAEIILDLGNANFDILYIRP